MAKEFIVNDRKLATVECDIPNSKCPVFQRAFEMNNKSIPLVAITYKDGVGLRMKTDSDKVYALKEQIMDLCAQCDVTPNNKMPEKRKLYLHNESVPFVTVDCANTGACPACVAAQGLGMTDTTVVDSDAKHMFFKNMADMYSKNTAAYLGKICKACPQKVR